MTITNPIVSAGEIDYPAKIKAVRRQITGVKEQISQIKDRLSLNRKTRDKRAAELNDLRKEIKRKKTGRTLLMAGTAALAAGAVVSMGAALAFCSCVPALIGFIVTTALGITGALVTGDKAETLGFDIAIRQKRLANDSMSGVSDDSRLNLSLKEAEERLGALERDEKALRDEKGKKEAGLLFDSIHDSDRPIITRGRDTVNIDDISLRVKQRKSP